MEKDSVLGPVDPQLKDMPAGALISLLERKPIESISDDNIMLSERLSSGLVTGLRVRDSFRGPYILHFQ